MDLGKIKKNRKKKDMIQIIFNKKQHQAEAYDDDKKIGECCFIESEETWNIVHTRVSKEYQGQGIARKLVENVIENAKKYHKNIVAECSYAKRIIENII